MFTVNYHTGEGNDVAQTIDEAMELADEGAAYTQESITIHDTDGEIVATRIWYGTTDGIHDEENPIRLGDFGFYGDWQDA